MSEQSYSQKYYMENKNKVKKYLSEKTICECGSVISRMNMSKHKRTKLHENKLRHNKYLQEKNDDV